MLVVMQHPNQDACSVTVHSLGTEGCCKAQAMQPLHFVALCMLCALHGVISNASEVSPTSAVADLDVMVGLLWHLQLTARPEISPVTTSMVIVCPQQILEAAVCDNRHWTQNMLGTWM